MRYSSKRPHTNDIIRMIEKLGNTEVTLLEDMAILRLFNAGNLEDIKTIKALFARITRDRL